MHSSVKVAGVGEIILVQFFYTTFGSSELEALTLAVGNVRRVARDSHKEPFPDFRP